VAVVVPNWNGADRLPACLESLAGQHQPATIVVVENGSVDRSAAVLEELTDRLRPASIVTLTNATNLGFAGGVNVGIRWALEQGCDAIALFNNDAVADRRWLSSLRGVLVAEPAVAIVTGRLLMGDGATVDSTGDFYTVWGLAFPRDRDQPADPVRPSGEVFGASGGASLFRSSLFADVGLFDEEFFAYFEDVDLSFRARLAGHGVRYCADAIAYHDQGATSRTVSGFVTRQFFRNLPLLLAKNVPARLLPAVVPRFLLVYSLMVVYQFRRGQGLAALGGVAQSFALVAHCLPRRRAIQRARRVDASVVRGLLWPGLPPGMRVLRGARDRLGAALRLRRQRRP
jgi:hypothetical protein